MEGHASLYTPVDLDLDGLYRKWPHIAETLLADRTTGRNIFWATDNYNDLGEGYGYDDEITIGLVTGANKGVVKPRAHKAKEWQKRRTKAMAEIFTPSWVCNKQCNMVDEMWFGRKDVFNFEVDDEEKWTHSWIRTEGAVDFPEGKVWLDYVKDNRLEITCGEAPYLVSRYDTVTGEPIDINNRIGLLDRKLRIVAEHTSTSQEWLEYALLAVKSMYGYEWQGDSLLIAREMFFATILEYHEHLYGSIPAEEWMSKFAEVISWNLWQMDGLKFVIPNSCIKAAAKLPAQPEARQLSLFDDEPVAKPAKKGKKDCACPGCCNKDPFKHIGIYTRIMDWDINESLEFVSMLDKSKVYGKYGK